MGKPTGFIDYRRVDGQDVAPAVRVQNDAWFHGEVDPEARRQQAGRCMECGVPFCQAGVVFQRKLVGCPLQNLIPEWNDQLWRGNLSMALDRLLHTNCFPEFTGYVCPAPCEAACMCGKVGEPVTVNANERYIIEQAYAQGLMKPQPPARRSGMSVAVVGSGPAGLTVAALLNRRGHRVTVYERSQTPGGLLVYGIPNMKLPKTVVARRVALLEAEGVEFRCGVDVGEGRDITVADLQAQNDAVVLCAGAQEPRVVAFDGVALGVGFALDYLGAAAAAHLDEAPLPEEWNAAGKVVAVIGAGDSANDCIATALRQGATDVLQLIRRGAEDYAGVKPSYAHEEAAAVLGRDIRCFKTTVASVSADPDGALKSVTLNTPDGPVTRDVQLLVSASGFVGPEAYTTAGVEAGEADGLFRAGDMVLGASLVVRAMADARQVAARVDAFLVG